MSMLRILVTGKGDWRFDVLSRLPELSSRPETVVLSI